jgi:aminopeptidase N
MRILYASLLVLTSFAHGIAQSVFSVRDQGEARDRVFDVLHYTIDVKIDDVQKEVAGRVTTTLVPFLAECRSIELDAEQMEIHRVTSRGRDLSYDVRSKTLAIHLDRLYSFHDTLNISVEYSCKPTRGLYFVQPDSGYPTKPWQVWSQGEDMDNHFWFPCYDFPNDKATTEVIATVKSKYTVLSNGKLVGVKEDKRSGTKTFHWKENKPHVSYLVMLAIGEYAVLRDKAGSVPLEYYVYPTHIQDASVCFSKTPDMVKFFTERIGFPYAWEKYAQVLIKDFVVGGMENSSATSLADEATVYDARARVDESPTSLIAHELAHQWWGDVVTCKDWRHLWLNESFATYFDPLYHEHLLGRDEFDYRMYNNQQAGIGVDKRLGRKPIISVGSYGENIYPRGASVLHMLRFILGDQLFWRAINHYITKHQFQCVETNDFKIAVEEATGQNLYWFFDQWVYKAGYPIFDLSYSWNDTTHSVALHVVQTQSMDSLTGTFRTPVDIELTTQEGAVTRRILLDSRDTICTLPCPSKPTLVIFDKGNWLLKELRFSKPDQEWIVQATRATNPIDRLRAIQTLLARQDTIACLATLAKIAAQDSFWAVRQEAVNAIGKLHISDKASRDEARQALLKAAEDARSSIRAAAVSHLSLFRGTEVVTALHKALSDSSYRVVASAVGALSKADSAGALPVIMSHITMPSHGNAIEAAALTSLQGIDSAKAISAALERVRYGQPNVLRFTAVHILARYAKYRPDLLPVLASLVIDKNSWVQYSAVSTLGDIGDPSVLPLLDELAGKPRDRIAATAKVSADKIRARLESRQ